MLSLNYNRSESDTLPEEIDTSSSPTTVYLRKNIHTEERKDTETGETRMVFVYDEAKMSRQAYVDYLSGKTQSDVAYLYMMGGLDYDE